MTDTAIGLVLAAGAGSRFGMPKALARTPEGTPWVHAAVAMLDDGGCGEVVVVLGALAESALHLVPQRAEVVLARDWDAGQSASLRAGLAACGSSDAPAVLVTLVDLPALTPEAARRMLAGARPSSLRRAMYDGAPGHPVLIGRDHWSPLLGQLSGDAGAGNYLAARGAREIDCTDLGGGRDIDIAS